MRGEGAGADDALEIRDLSHAFGTRTALDSVSLSVPAGAFTALLGLNGAGKTTLFSLVTRLYRSRSGSIRVLGYDLRREPGAALAALGVVFQARTLDPELSLRQNLVYHAALHGIGFGQGGRRAEELLERAGLGERAGDKARSLSGGQMRRLEIVRALLHRPRLLLLDEPTVGLDLAARRSLVAEVRGLVAEEGVGVLWATHLIEEVGPGDRVAVLHRGRMLAQDTCEGLMAGQGAADLGEAFGRLVGLTEPAGTGP